MTIQAGEMIIFEGVQLYTEEGSLRLAKHPRIIQVSNEEAKVSNDLFFTTALWRGYVGHWEIKEGRLYLNLITGAFKLLEGEPLFAEWITSTIRMPVEAGTHIPAIGYQSTFDTEIIVEIEGGVVQRTWGLEEEWARPWPASQAWKGT
jgi:hypothetical protein